MQIDSNIPEVARRQIEHIAEVCERIKPLVVISCITYNHGPYLRDALEGFLMQKTDFPFVAVVHEDASTDDTAVVLRDYAERYPDIILPIFEEENQYSKRNKSIERIMDAATEATGAKYIALCEGDDYWTNENKLQKQVDFLETHLNYSMCYHNAIVHYENGDKEDRLNIKQNPELYNEKETFMSIIVVPTASMVFRATIIDSPYYHLCNESSIRMNGDNKLNLTCRAYGRVKYIDKAMSVYRLLPTGWSYTTGKEIKTKIYEIEIFREYERIFGRRYQSVLQEHYARLTREGIAYIRRGKLIGGIKIFCLYFKCAPLVTIRSYWHGVKKRLSR